MAALASDAMVAQVPTPTSDCLRESYGTTVVLGIIIVMPKLRSA
jgi:hypothetical protein